MADGDETLASFADYGVAPERIRSLIHEIRSRIDRDVFFVFQATSGAGIAGSGRRNRTLMAFASPDTALVFAQRNNLVSEQAPPRLKPMRLVRLLLAMAMAQNIQAILLVDDETEIVRGQMPNGELIERSRLR